MSLDISESAQIEPGIDTSPERSNLEALLGETFAAVRQRAFAYCLAILKDPTLAEDAVQSAFVEIHRRIRGGDARFFADAPWDTVKRNLRWAALKQRREAGQSDRWFTPLDGDPGAPAKGYAEVEGRLVADHILAQLPNSMREVLRLRAMDQAPDAVSAAQLGITIDAFRCRYKRAVTAARAAARGLGIEGTAGVLVTAVRRRWTGLRARWLRGANRGAATAARFADVADNLVRSSSINALGAIAVAVISGATTSLAAPALPAAERTTGAGIADGTWHPVGAADRYASGSQAQQRRAGAGAGLIAPALPGLPELPAPGASRSAASETPEDTTFFTATPASQPGYTSWIMALGWGKGCRCAVLFQSRDGGGSWAAAEGPPANSGGDQRVTLPPSYPIDPRIFISGPAGSPSYSTRRFGEPFMPLPVPSGSIAVSPLYDRGDDRIFIAGQAAVWTYNLDTRTLQPVVVEGAVSRIIGIASPAQPGGPQLFVIADNTSLNAAVAGAQSQPGLFECDTAQACTYLSTPPLAAAASVAVSPGFSTDRTLEVAWIDRVAISHDGGHSFALVTTPVQNEPLVSSFLSTSRQGPPLSWAVFQVGNTDRLLRLGVSGSAWQQVLGDGGSSDEPLLGAVASGERVIALLAGGGLLCSADGGTGWASRCPAGSD